MPPRELTDDEVFGPAAVSATTGSGRRRQRELTDDEVFGPAAQSRPGLTGYGVETAKAAAQGFVEGTVASPLRGYGAAFEEVPVDPIASYTRAQELVQQGLSPSMATKQAVEETRQRMPKPRPVTESPLYQAGEAVSRATKEFLAPKDILHPLVRDVASGVGSFGGNVLSAVISPWAAMGMLTGQGMGEAAENAVKFGKASPQQQIQAAGVGAWAGATEFVDALIPMMGSTGKAAGLLMRVGTRALKGAFLEGGQEGLQKFVQNAIERNIYNPDRDYSHDVPYNALVGAIVGGGVASIMGGEGGRPTEQTTPQQIEADLAAQPTVPAQPTQPQPAQPPVADEQLDLGLETPDEAALPPGATLTKGGVVGGPAAAPTTPETGTVPASAVPEEPAAPPPRPLRTPRDLVEGELNLVWQHGIEPYSDWTGKTSQRFPLGPDEVAFLRRQGFRVADDGTLQRETWERIRQKVYGDEPTTGQMNPAVVDFLQRMAPPLEVGTPEEPIETQDPMAPAAETIKGKPGVSAKRTVKLLGQTLYGSPSETGKVSVKEIVQNSFDGIKGLLDAGRMTEGNIDIDMNPTERTITVVDDGSGMTPEVLSTKFLQVAGSEKTAKDPSGGLGIAKLQFLFSNDALRVITMRDGKVAEMKTDGTTLFEATEDESLQPDIDVRTPTAADRKMFPKGHGTMVSVKIPASYEDTQTGEKRPINFPSYDFEHPVLENSPLFRNVNVRFKGKPLNIGSRFPKDDYTPFANFNFKWGTARLYVSKNKRDDWKNVDVLSNGLWQFSLRLMRKSRDGGDENIPRRFIFDMKPTVTPTQPGYPFDLNRQRFTQGTEESFGKILGFVKEVYREADLKAEADSFGDIHYLRTSASGGIEKSETYKVQPKVPTTPSPLRLIQPGDTVEVTEDGKLSVKGRVIPELTPDQIEKYEIDYSTLKIDQSEIDTASVMVHDNVQINVSPSEIRSIIELGRERYGQDFDSYILEIGDAFQDLRSVVAEEMNYPKMRSEAVGISFDIEYRGVSIRLPFAGFFLNPAATEYTDTVRSAVGMVYTMVHELAHHRVRSHDADFPAEMQRILIHLDASTKFNFQRFKQRVVTAVNNHQQVADFLYGAFNGDLGRIEARGSRFQDSGSNEARTGGGAGGGAEAVGPTTGTGGMAAGDDGGAGTAMAEPRRGNVSVRPAGTSSPDNDRSVNAAAIRSDRGPEGDRRPDPDTPAEAIQPETRPARAIQSRVLSGNVPPTARASAGHADRMNVVYKYFAGLDQLLLSNPFFLPLRLYKSLVQRMQVEETQLQDVAVKIGKDWRSAGEEGDRLGAMLHDLTNMTYLSPLEVSRGIVRHPSPQELEKMFQQHKLGSVGRGLYTKVTTMVDGFMTLVGQSLSERVARGPQTPTGKAKRLQEIANQLQALKARPYFPFMRFGQHYVYVRDPAGHMTNFETFERRGLSRAEWQQKHAVKVAAKEWQRKYGRAPKIGEDIVMGTLPDSAGPLVGMPSLLLEGMIDAQHLSEEQINAATMLMQAQLTGMTPILRPSSQKRYNVPSYSVGVPGYSRDAKRAFAKFFFHGSRYLTRVKYVDQLKEAVKTAEAAPGNKETKIGAYMRNHLDKAVLDARGDFGIFRGAIFTWAMGYVPAAATMNLSQVPMVSFPWLAAKFGGIVKGDVVASKALVEAMGQVTSTYRPRSFYKALNATSEFELRALSYGIETGRITETQAPELAGLAQGAGLLKGIGGNKIERGAVQFLEKGAWMFEMAEQFNRRVTYRAALKLAMRYPDAKAVQEALDLHPAEAADLMTRGFTQGQAAAIVTANHAVDQTQYVYSRWARPKFMRGPAGATLFVFKKYLQSTLFMLAQNPWDVAPRYLVIAAFVGGMMGLPGMEDFQSLLKAAAKLIYGKDFNLEHEARKYVLQFAGGHIDPDMFVHGMARRGMGIPALLDLLGSFVTGTPGRGFEAPRHVKNEQTGQLEPRGFGQNVPYPVFDRSRAFSMGMISPFDIGKTLTPGSDVEKVLAEQTQRASGAVFSVGFNIYKAIVDSSLDVTDWKRWERAVPRGLSNISRAWRAYDEGRERSKGGPYGGTTVIEYDRRDTEQMMEVLGILGGYQPLRLQARWDSIMAKMEHDKYIDFKREGLMQQFYEAKSGGRKDEIKDVVDLIKKFNADVRGTEDRGKAITEESIQRSYENRVRGRALRELGVGPRPTSGPISREINRLYPEATVDVRRVRPQ